MKFIFIMSLFLIGGCSSGYDAGLECYSTRQFRKAVTPSFGSYIMNVRSTDQSRIDMYLQMPYRHLRFEKYRDGYKASYTISIIIRNDKKEIITSREIDRSVFARMYDETVSDKYDFHLQSFELLPNIYTIESVSVDNLSQLRYRQIDSYSVSDYSNPSKRASTILFLENMVNDGNSISLRPILPSSMSRLKDSIGMFQELYHLSPFDTVKISQQYKLQSKEKDDAIDFSYLMPPYRLPNADCSIQYDSIVYERDSVVINNNAGSIQLFQFYPLPPIGSTELKRSIIMRNGDKIDSIVLSNTIYRRPYQYRSSVSPDEIASSMRYILREEEYDSLLSLTGEKRNQWIDTFWIQRGGMERKTLFERRIFEANSLFTSCTAGSQTTMGIVYIICGTPDYIDCRSSYDENWYYGIGDRAYGIQFRRENENASSFDLVPFSVSDNLWQYYIDTWRRKR